MTFACVKEVRHLCTHAGSVEVDHATSAVLPNMETARNYTVNVAGKTSRSIGQLSKKVIFRMAAEEVPKDVHVVSVTKDSITLRWKPPLVVVPSRYLVTYKGRRVFLDEEGGTNIRQTPRGSNETAKTEMTIHGLRPHTTYYINLTAIPQDGRETPAVRLEIRTAVDGRNVSKFHRFFCTKFFVCFDSSLHDFSTEFHICDQKRNDPNSAEKSIGRIWPY